MSLRLTRRKDIVRSYGNERHQPSSWSVWSGREIVAVIVGRQREYAAPARWTIHCPKFGYLQQQSSRKEALEWVERREAARRAP